MGCIATTLARFDPECLQNMMKYRYQLQLLYLTAALGCMLSSSRMKIQFKVKQLASIFSWTNVSITSFVYRGSAHARISNNESALDKVLSCQFNIVFCE
jgi:hypothetical protein